MGLIDEQKLTNFIYGYLGGFDKPTNVPHITSEQAWVLAEELAALFEYHLENPEELWSIDTWVKVHEPGEIGWREKE